jgi:ParB family chromosome partitioning protein
MNMLAKVSPAVSLHTARVEEARALLAEVKSVDDAAELRNQADAIEVYHRRRAAASGAHADAWEIVKHAERRLGELLRELPTSPGGRPKKQLDDAEVVVEETLRQSGKVTKGEKLKELGISTQDASKLERLADLPDDEYAKRIETGRARIAKQSTDPGSVTATSAASDHDGDVWGTPPEYLDAARTVLGRIELDPATNLRAQELVRAERFYTAETNGLAQSWKADTLWLNPPYSMPLIAKFAGRWAESVSGGVFGSSIMLVNNATDAAWFHAALEVCTAVCFTKGRIAFLDADRQPVKGNSHGQAIFYAGPKLPLFRKTFGEFGAVLIGYKR